MTVPSTTSRVNYSGDGSSVSFPISFYFLANADLVVLLVSAAGISTTQVLNTNYTLTGAGSEAGGTLTMLVAPPSGSTLVIFRDPAVTQLVDYAPNDPFPAETHERALDRLTMISQRFLDLLNRTFRISDGSTINSTILDVSAASRANKVMSFDAAGDLIAAQELGIWQGNWASGTNYNTRDLIKDTSNNNIYICIAEHVAGGAQPISSNADVAKWALIVDAAAAATSASAAAASAIAAAGSATDADDSATAAATSEANAADSASNAATSATDALDSAADSATSAVDAAQSASDSAINATAAASSATAAAASEAAAAAVIASGMYSAVQDKTGSYTVLAADAGDLIRVDTSGGAATITLPVISSVTDGFKVAIVKWSGDANAVTVQRSSSDLINGALTYLLDAQYKSATYVADFQTNTWFAAGTGGSGTNVIIDTFSGNASTTAFTLAGDPGSENNTQVFISGVYQNKSQYSVSGTTITFTAAPPTGTNNIEVVWSQPVPIGTPSDGTVSTIKINDSAVTTAKIADDAVTTAKVANALFSGLTSVAPAVNDYVPLASTANSGGKRKALLSDVLAFAVAFPSGTRMAFQQTTAPTGWTKDTTAAINDSILRLVTGSASSGGSLAFSSWAAQTADGATTLSTAQMPSHSHTYWTGGTKGGGAGGFTTSATPTQSTTNTTYINSTGGGGSHTHSLSQSLKYYDFIIASKD